MTNSMRDYERQQFENKMATEAERQNQLLASQIHEQRQARREQKEQAYKNRIYQLRLAYAQAADFNQREQIQMLLDEATADYESYLERLRKERRFSQIIGYLALLFMVPLMVFGIWDMANGKKGTEVESVQEQITSSKPDSSSGPNGKESILSQTTSTDSSSPQSLESVVSVTIDGVLIRQTPSLSATTVDTISRGSYTIVETKSVDGYLWGKLKSGVGWIALDMVGGKLEPRADDSSQTPRSTSIEVDTRNLTTEQVQKWVKASFLRRVERLYERQIIHPDNVQVNVWKSDEDGLVYSQVILPEQDLSYLLSLKPALYEKELNYRINQDGVLEDYAGMDGGGPNHDGSPSDYEWEFEEEYYNDVW